MASRLPVLARRGRQPDSTVRAEARRNLNPMAGLSRSLAIVTLALVVSACSSSTVTTEVLVSAAASLTDAFSEMEERFEETHSGIDVVMNHGGSSTLREQILGGAPVDVFASANHSNMDVLVEAGMVDGQPVVFATNLLEIAVPGGNPAGVTGLEDFADESLLIGLCAPSVPCGDFARRALANAGVTAAIDTYEPDVRALLTKLEAGELDAGITYVTDVASTDGTVEGIEIPGDDNVVADYPIALLSDAPNRDEASEFIDFVLSDEGRAVLGRYGFSSP